MNGGTISKVTREPDGIVLKIKGTGPMRHKVETVKILPTNYNFSAGDLVWWYNGVLRWEGKVSCPFHRADGVGVPDGQQSSEAGKRFWHAW